MNKILLIGINARYSHPAMALYYLKEYVRDLQYQTIIAEFTIRTPVPDILKLIEEEKPACVAFSVYIWNTSVVKDILQRMEYSSARPKVILGGPDAACDPDSWLSGYPLIDCIITGHGEQAFRSYLESGLKPTSKILTAENPPFSDIPFPYSEEDLRNFAHRKIYYESGRGCPFRCAYCLSSRKDQRLEFRDTDKVSKELDLIIRHKPGIIKFVDRTFNINKLHYMAVWLHIICSYPEAGTRFHFEIHPGLLGEDDFRILEHCPAGLFQFEIGIQSVNPEALKAVNREEEWGKIKPAIERVISLGTIPVHVDLIAGLPFEDYNSLAESFNEVYSLSSNYFQFGYLKALPGTEVRERAAGWNLNYTPDPPYEIIGNKWLSPDEVTRIKIISRLLDTVYNSHRFIITLENILPRYNSPFGFFEKIADCIPVNQKDFIADWENTARLIMTAGNNDPFVFDCLRWDWCLSSRTNRYPRMLKTEAMRKKRKELLVAIAEGRRIPGAEELDEAVVRKSKIFVPETWKFREKYLAGKNFALFPEGQQALLLK